MSEPTSAELVRQVGLALYGSRWEAALARDLKVDVRTLRRWASYREEPPAGVWLDMLELVRNRHNQNVRVAVALVGRIGGAHTPS